MKTPQRIPRCQFRVPPENLQCELRMGHKLVHLAGMYYCPVTEEEKPPATGDGKAQEGK